MALEKVKRERESTKVTITWLETRYNDHAITPITLTKVDHYLATVGIHELRIEDQFQRIVALEDPANLDPHSIEYTDLLDRALDLKDKFTTIRKTFVIPTTGSSSTSSSGTTTEIRLPRLELPTFDGTLRNWVSFRDMFVTAVHDNKSLSNSQKLTYLKAQLKGEAARQISNMTITDANYDIAWDQLATRYQNDRELLFEILRRFVNQPMVQPHSGTAIRTIVDVSRECIRSLQVLGLPTDKWDAILLYLILMKMDPSSKELWEQSLKDSSIPSLKSLFEFMEQRARALTASGAESTSTSTKASNGSSNQGVNKNQRPQNRNFVHHTHSPGKCKICNEDFHPLYRCDKFLGWLVQQRSEAIRKLNACYNCLREGHKVSECPSKTGCKTCGARHNTLLHKLAAHTGARAPTNTPATPPPTSTTTPATFFTASRPNPTPAEYDTLLATALVQVVDKQGQPHTFRALCDNGSNTHFVTDSCIKKLGAPRKRCFTSATGLGGSSVASSNGVTQFTVSSHFDNSITFPISRCLITTKITGKLPTSPFDHNKWSHLQGLQLADPGYHEPRGVDMLLGAEFFYSIIENGKQSGPPNSPIAIKTSFGWLIGGGSAQIPLFDPQVHTTLSTSTSTNTLSSSSDLDEHLDSTLRRFWEMESEPVQRHRSAEELQIESHFKSTHERDGSGRFCVQLPFKIPRLAIGSSFNIAMKRLLYLERRLKSNPDHQKEYHLFMKEYEELGHMQEVQPVDPNSNTVCYIPHHFVVKASSTTTKFRVVFDASAKTSNGVSLNDTMMVGPTIQDSLVDILIRFRLHKIAFTADIAKMYRQIKMYPPHCDLQRILWRTDPTKSVKHYQLLTVTYGKAEAPFQATRVVQELATSKEHSLPRATKVAQRDLYVDDLMSGEPSVQDALATQSELLSLMESGAMSLRKWSSNSQQLLDSLPQDMRETQSILSFDTDDSIKTLGICWNPNTDQFMFKVNPPSISQQQITKRIVLSELARLFDPVGWLAPLIISAKILMQSLWKLQQGWDDPLLPDLSQQWEKFRLDIEGLSNLKINRYFMCGTQLTCPSLNVPFSSDVKFCLAGFCDASQKAYAAAVYFCAYQNQTSSVALISSKTRVAPVKEVSLPRLELCGAHLLAELIGSVQLALKIPFHSITAWTDSTVTLAWIQSTSSRWKTFVANRVTKIQEKVPAISWGHVRGEENPADCASRGIPCEELINHSLWWSGPTWLKNGIPSQIPPPQPDDKVIAMINLEAKRVTTFYTISKPNQLLLDKYSSLLTLVRVTAFIFRFLNNCKMSQKSRQERSTIMKKSSNSPPVEESLSILPPLSPSELIHAQEYWIKLVQQQYFSHEINALLNGKSLPAKSKVLPLSPFVDTNGILRVGGRLRNSHLPTNQKHPILLPTHGRFTQLLIQQEHLRFFHAGPQLVMSILRHRYWILRVKDSVRRQIHDCVICTRHKAETLQQVMADLPSFRVTPARAFSKCGVDYAGPFLIKPIQPRSKITIKAYLSVFVCCTTRAIHLEVVSSLSTDAFLSAFRRFISRRGVPTNLYSDCGTNFVGANREMLELHKLLLSQQHNQSLADQLSKDGTTWTFNCPGAPHFGGLWEAGVKSVKHHLRRVMGLQRFTFEEMTTVTSQIEAILNSRPLTPESSSPDDFNALTPGHFLIGAPLNAIPEPDLDLININRLGRWQLLQQMVQSFWKRWSNEYLTRLQQRPKWMTGVRKLEIGDMVLIKDENLPPLKWQLGRVIILHPGSDSVVRVVTLKTSTGQLKRPVVKVCLLPISNPSITPTAEEDSATL